MPVTFNCAGAGAYLLLLTSALYYVAFHLHSIYRRTADNYLQQLPVLPVQTLTLMLASV